MSAKNNLKKIRDRKAISIEEAAAELDMEVSRLGNIENGRIQPSGEELEIMARYYGITVEDIVRVEEMKKVKRNSFSNKNDRSLCEPWGNVFHFEYKSRATVGRIPLIHINIGLGAYSAKGIIAIGNFACGVISIGGISVGILSIGLLCIGIIALGLIAFGAFAAGAAAIGICAVGGLSIGYLTVGGVEIGRSLGFMPSHFKQYLISIYSIK